MEDMDEQNEVQAIIIDDDLVQEQQDEMWQEEQEEETSSEEDNQGRFQEQKEAYVKHVVERVSTNLKLGSIESKINQLLETAEQYASFLLTRHKQVQRQTLMASKEIGRHRLVHVNDDEMIEQCNGFTRLNKQPKLLQGGELKDYQLTGLNWIISLYETGINGILADEMGLGKTIQTLAFFAYLKEQKRISGPHLVVAPKSTLGNWMREFKKWLPSCRVVKLIAVKEERDDLINRYLQPGKFDVCLTSYEGINICLQALRRFTFKYIIVDEAHKIKNEDAMISQNIRRIRSGNKLLLSGTPLQNTPHELWSLLNYLLPDLFNSSEVFDRWFEVNVEAKQQGGEKQISQEELERSNLDMVQKFHKILRPFMLRRTKAEVEKFLPPKKEIHLFVRMSLNQRQMYQNIIVSNNPADTGDGTGGAKHFYNNKLMQLRKICLHPYLFPEVEDLSQPALGEHLIEISGKLRVLDKLLVKLSHGHQVLIFSQFTMMLNILEDYCNLRGYTYCRIDGDTEIQKRDDQIADFSAPDSQKYIFLLSTRAGGLGINLASADTGMFYYYYTPPLVIIYDSDFNPQMDLQAMDRAHRIGQVNQVMVYRLVCEHTVEEKIIERQQIKLRWDSLMIQQGRMHQKGSRILTKDELKEITQFGASQIFKIESDDIREEDIELLLERGRERTAEMNIRIEARFSTLKDKTLDLGLGQINIFDYFEENIRIKEDEDALDEAMALQLLLDNTTSRRDKKHIHLKKKITGKQIKLLDHHLYRDRERLQQLLQKEEDYLTYLKYAKNSAIHFEKDDDEQVDERGLTPSERKQCTELSATGFPEWTRQEFTDFLLGSEKYGRNDITYIQEVVKTKTVEQVKAYKMSFWSRGIEGLADRDKIAKQIEKGEKMLSMRTEGQRLVEEKCRHFHCPRYELVFTPHLYQKVKSKFYSLDNDRYLIYMSNEVGYGNLTALKKVIRRDLEFKFDHAFKYFLFITIFINHRSKSEQELKNRITTLLKVLEREKELMCLGRPIQKNVPFEKPKVLLSGSRRPEVPLEQLKDATINKIDTEVKPARKRPSKKKPEMVVTPPNAELEKIQIHKRVKLNGSQ